MTRQLTPDDRVILNYMSEHGAYRPGTNARWHRCQILIQYGYVAENDAWPGSYEITSDGEKALEAEKEKV